MKKIVFYEANLEFDKSNWQHIFSAALGREVIVQNNFSALIGEKADYSLDMGKGIFTLNKEIYAVQLIGNETTEANIWTWGWSKEGALPDTALRIAKEVKGLGDAWALDPLTTPQFQLTEHFNGHNLSMVACALSKENLCYLRFPHKSGHVFVAFPFQDARVFAPVSIAVFANAAMECLKKFPVDHKVFIESFLLQNGTPFRWQENAIVASFSQDLIIQFEEIQGTLRVCEIKTA